MKTILFFALVVIAFSKNSYADGILGENIYKPKDFEFKCSIRAALEPSRPPLCPLIYQFSYESSASVEAVKATLEEKIQLPLLNDDFFQAKSVFIADLNQRREKMGITEEFTKGYDPYLTRIQASLRQPISWRDETTNYIVLVSPTQHTLYIFRGAGAQ